LSRDKGEFPLFSSCAARAFPTDSFTFSEHDNMTSMNAPADEDDAREKEILSLFSSMSEATLTAAPTGGGPSSGAIVVAIVRALHEKLNGPRGVVDYLVPRLWTMTAHGDDIDAVLMGDDALAMLSLLVESRPDEYAAPSASAVRLYVERVLANAPDDDDDDDVGDGRMVSDALLSSLSRLLVGTGGGNDRVGVVADAHSALLALCRIDRVASHRDGIAKRVLAALDSQWNRLRGMDMADRRASSTSQIRIAALVINICLLGGEEMSWSLSCGIIDGLLRIALDVPNDDPLLQLSALDQLERLTVQGDVNASRADFLLGNDVLRRGLLCLVGSRGDLTRDANDDDAWDDMDPINGGAALRLLSEICRVGITTSSCVRSEGIWDKFNLLLANFHRALQNVHPRSELERLSYIHAVSSLVGSCASVASSRSLASDVACAILDDRTLLHEWLSLHGRASQPKLKSAVLCSLSQVIEPSMWQDSGSEQSHSGSTVRPADGIAIRLYRAFGDANNDRDPTEVILASAKSPFIEERLGAYDILRALVMRSACLRLLLLFDDGTGKSSGGSGSFLEWLLNQDMEYTVEGKRAKYHIAESMLSCNASIIGGLLPPRGLSQVEEWIRKGPNFVTAESWEMATE
jgi:hypothetical protein